MLSAIYAAIVRRRRERYAARPDLRRRLRRPVISVGNLAVGGRGKTPTVATIARLLLEMGERPAVLSRGYGRREAADGVVVVRDPGDIRADVARSGDEPFMLARQLPGVSVLVSPERYLAGCLAEHRFGATVHILDDGFQHLQLERDIDIVLIGRGDVAHPLTLPFGRLREPLDTLVAADAVIAVDDDVQIDTVRHELPVFRATRLLGRPVIPCEGPAFACAGIAEPADVLRGPVELGARHPGHPGVPRPPRLHLQGRQPHFRGGEGRRGGRGPDDGEGLRPAAAVPAVSAPDGLRAAYNGTTPATRVPALARRLALGGSRRHS